MNSIRGAIENTVPISQFNRGLAGQIFEDAGIKDFNEFMFGVAGPRSL